MRTLECEQAYHTILDAVSVTPEMERRVLAGLRNTLAAETPPVQGIWSAQQYDSTGELAQNLPYTLLLPTWLPEGYTLTRAACLPGQLAEVCWQGEDCSFSLRASAGLSTEQVAQLVESLAPVQPE